MPDSRIVGGGQNEGPIIAATVKNFLRGNPIGVVLMNASGDVYNALGPAGGAASNVNVDQINSQTPDMNTGNAGAGTLRVVLASDQPTVPISGTLTATTSPPPVTGVQAVGGSFGGRVSISGDSLLVNQQGAWATSVTGDVLLRANPGTNIGNVNLAGVLGVQIVGGGNARVSISGDTLLVNQQGAWASSITGDVLLRANVGTDIGNVGIKSGQSIGTTQSGAWSIAGSGDVNLVDGVDRSIKNTVRDYANSNPIAVVLTNPSGDSYMPTPKEPICATIPFRVTSAGTTTLAGPYNGRVIKVCSYDLQGEGGNAGTTQCKFGSAASGSQLTPQWQLNAREGVAKQVSPVGGGYIFKTILNQALVLENSGASVIGSVTFHTGDSF